MNYWEENSNEKWTRNYEINKSTLREKQIQIATTKEKPTLNKKKWKINWEGNVNKKLRKN